MRIRPVICLVRLVYSLEFLHLHAPCGVLVRREHFPLAPSRPHAHGNQLNHPRQAAPHLVMNPNLPRQRSNRRIHHRRKAEPPVDLQQVKNRLLEWSDQAAITLRTRADDFTETTKSTFSQLGAQLNKVTGYEEIEIP